VKLEATELPGAFVVELEPHADERGFFARQWCAREFAERGLDARLAQVSVSHNTARATLRGMHYQAAPHGEAKLVSCVRGAIFDVLVDLRAGATRAKWIGVELSAANRRALYVPDGVAHGFVTLADDSDVQYCISTFHEPSAARGVRWNDPAFAIRWPIEPRVMSARDASYADYAP
jgi:dTDP-4-dehydrorhamnose 3,5-epimerase